MRHLGKVVTVSPELDEGPRILVLGGTGFIGRWMVAALMHRGHRVRMVARRVDVDLGCECVYGDLADTSVVRRACHGVHTVLHCAGNANESDEDHAREVGINTVLADIAMQEGVRKIIYISTVKVMGAVSDGKDETSPVAPGSEYARAKAAIERIFLDKASASVSVVVLRLPPVYGEICKGNLGRLVRMIGGGLVPRLPDTGLRSLVHVADVVQAVLLAYAFDGASATVYNVTDGAPYSLSDLYGAVRQADGKAVSMWGVSAGVLRLLGRAGQVVGTLRRRRLPFDRLAIEQLLAPAWYRAERIVTALGYLPQHRFSAADGAREMLLYCRGCGRAHL